MWGIPETKQGPAGKNSVFSPEGIRTQSSGLTASKVFLCLVLESETASARGSLGGSGGKAEPAPTGTVARELSLETKVTGAWVNGKKPG